MCPCDICFPNNGTCLTKCQDGSVSCPLLDGEKVAEQPVNLPTLTEKLTNRAIATIEENSEEPFFLYVAYHHTHAPQFASR